MCSTILSGLLLKSILYVFVPSWQLIVEEGDDKFESNLDFGVHLVSPCVSRSGQCQVSDGSLVTPMFPHNQYLTTVTVPILNFQIVCHSVYSSKYFSTLCLLVLDTVHKLLLYHMRLQQTQSVIITCITLNQKTIVSDNYILDSDIVTM